MSRSRLMPGKTTIGRRACQRRLRTRKLSITVLASSLRAISSACARARAGSVSSSSSSITLPARTSPTLPKPRPRSAWPIALPCGIEHARLQHHRDASPLHCIISGPFRSRDAGLGQDAEPARDFLVGLLDLAEVAAEAVLVHLLVGLGVPQAAIVRADLVGQHDAHLLVLPQPAELELEIDQGDPDAEEQAGQEVVDPQGQCDDVVHVLRCRPSRTR